MGVLFGGLLLGVALLPGKAQEPVNAEFFEKQFAPSFAAKDFVNIENYNAYVRILARGVPQRPFNIKSLSPVEGNKDQVNDLRELSYLTYGRDRDEVEAHIRERYLS